jgi:hypothetical protein
VEQFNKADENGTLDPEGVKAQIMAFNTLTFGVTRRYNHIEGSSKTVQSVGYKWVGAQVFRYILDGEDYNYPRPIHELADNFPHFDIGQPEKTLTIEQMERVIDIYNGIRPTSDGRALNPDGGANARDVYLLKGFILKRIVKPFLAGETAKGQLSPEVKSFVGKLKTALGPEFDARINELIMK